MADIFISYAREDVERVRVLADALAAEGWSVFWDRTIPFGMTWRQVIGKEIDEARCVLVVWSTAAIGSTWVHEEADDGARRGILIPVLIEPVMPPIGFRSYQAADLSDWDGTKPTPVFERLIADIARLLEPAPMEVDEARPRTETERQAEEAEAKRRADEEESRTRAEQEAKRKAEEEEEERKRAEERRKAEVEAARKAEETAAMAERASAEPHKRSRARTWIVATVMVVLVVSGIGAAILWQSSPSEEERLARQEQMAAEEEAKRKAEEQEARRREEAEAQRRAEEEGARRRAEEEAARRAEDEAQRRAEEEEARRRAEEEAARRAEDEALGTRAESEADRDRVLEAQSLLADLGYDPGPPDGVVGRQTRTAIERHQAAAGLRVDGEVTPSLLASLREVHGATAAKRAEPAIERSPGQPFKDCDVCPEMVVVPAGSFMMGSPPSEKERDDDEGPQHRVTIAKPFAVGKFEVTFAQWDACVDDGGCNGYRPEDRWGRGIQPVIFVNWNDARSYVKWLRDKTGNDYRLLREAEWEYAARAGMTTRYWWGDAFDVSRANNDRNGTTAVERYPANAFGLHDVHGNVREWVEDCWHGNYDGAPSDGSAWTTGGDCSRRVLRGGSWVDRSRFLRSAIRIRSHADDRINDAGFRVARTF